MAEIPNPTPQLTGHPVGYYPDEFELEALQYIKYNMAEWDDEAVFITDKLQYMMRNVIKKARKFYAGVFDDPRDSITGEEKTWVPLVEWSVESVVKSIDLDMKDILIRPGTPQAVGVVPIIRAVILNALKKAGFGQLLDDLLRIVSRDGTVVIKTITVVDKRTGKKMVKSYPVNLLNWWIDPAADSVQESSACIERSYMAEGDVKSMDGVWKNTQFVDLSLTVPKIAEMYGGGAYGAGRGKLPYTEIWELWGKIKKSWVTKNHEDDNTWIEGHLVSSGLGGPRVMHLERKNPRKDGIRPYEEAWYRRVDGRWFGRGVAEMLFGVQEYVNATVNIRKNNNMLLQNGIFLVRKGSGLTPDMMSRIAAGGGVPVTDINKDVKQLTVQDFRQSSYTDEDRTYLMADRVTGAFDINRGEVGRASASATATLTRDRNIRDTFVLVQEGIGFFVERLIIRQYIPLLKEILKSEDAIRISGTPQEIEAFDNAIIDIRQNTWIREFVDKTGFYPDEAEIQEFRDKQVKMLKAGGKDRFVQYFAGIFDEDIDIDVSITDEKFNRTVAVQQLRDMLIGYSRLPVASRLNVDAIIQEMLNMMGIRGEFFLEKPQVPSLSGEASQVGRLGKALPEGMPTETGAFENAAGMPETGGGIDMSGGIPAAPGEGGVGRPPLASQ